MKKDAVNDEKKIMSTKRRLADIYCQVVNYERYRPDLQAMPHEKRWDLAIIYYTEEKSDEEVTAAPLDFERMAELGLEEKEVRNAAWKNTILKKRAVLMPLSEVVGSEEENSHFYVLTNEDMRLGAVAVFYPDLLEVIADEMDCDLYILPSSIHECLIVPEYSELGTDEMRAMVKSVNDTEVREDEILSYNVYKFNRSDRRVTIDNG